MYLRWGFDSGNRWLWGNLERFSGNRWWPLNFDPFFPTVPTMVTTGISYSDTETIGTLVRIGCHWPTYRLALQSGLGGSVVISTGTLARNHFNKIRLTRLSALSAILGLKRWTGWRIQILQWFWLGRNWRNTLETDRSWNPEPLAKIFPFRFLQVFQPAKCTIEPSPCA